jgi:hypothetical protein
MVFIEEKDSALKSANGKRIAAEIWRPRVRGHSILQIGTSVLN